MTDKPTRGGARPGSGPKPQTTDGGPLVQKRGTFDATTIRIMTEFGDGEFSEGVRRAARIVAERDDESALQQRDQ